MTSRSEAVNDSVVRLANFAHEGKPADYGGSELMRNDLIAAFKSVITMPAQTIPGYTNDIIRLGRILDTEIKGIIYLTPSLFCALIQSWIDDPTAPRAIRGRSKK